MAMRVKQMNTVRGVAALLLAAGHATSAGAAVFVFSQQCATPNWTGNCTGAPCVPSGTQTFNNWGQTSCGTALAAPGPADTADIRGATVTMNAGASVQNILTDPSTALTWSAGNLTVTLPTTLSGTTQVTGSSNRNMVGSISNGGAWSEDTGGFTTFLSSTGLANDAGADWTITNNNWARVGSSTNTFNNAGTFRKLGPATATITSIGIAHAGTLRVEGGTLTLAQNTQNLSFAPSSTTTILSGANLVITEPRLSGVMTGTNAGGISLVTPSHTVDFTIAMTGNPVLWTGGNWNTNSNTLTIAPGATLEVTGPTTRSISSTSIVNNGVMVENTGGLATNYSTVNMTNNGTHELVGQTLARFGSSGNTYTNNGTLRTTGPSTINSIPLTSNGLIHVPSGTLTLASNNNVFAPTSTTNVGAAGTLSLASSSIAGTLAGTNSGTVLLNTISLADNTAWNMSGNALQWTGGSLSGSGQTVTVGAMTDVVTTGGANRSLSGVNIINNGDWTDDTGGFLTSLSTANVTNNGSWTMAGQSWARFGSSANTFVNNGVWNKTTPIASAVTGIAVTHNGELNVQAGGLTLSGGSFTASASSETNVDATGTLTVSCPVSGDIEGTNNGTVVINGMSLFANTTLNMGPGETTFLTASTNLGGNTLTWGATTRVRNTSAVNKGISSGSIVNNGDWLEDTGGFATSLSTVAVTNNGTLTFGSHNLARTGSSTNSVTNNGTIRKIGPGAASIGSMSCINNGLWDVEEGSFSRTGTFTTVQNPGATFRVRKDATASLAGAIWQGGTISGLGQLSANLNLALAPHVISPGDPGDEGGTLSLSGTLVLSPTTQINIELDARPGTPADTDRVNVNGQFQLNGAILNVSLAPDFVPTVGDEYTIINTFVLNPAQGTFGTINYDVPPGVTFDVSYGAGLVRLTVVTTLCDTIDFNQNGVFPEDQDVVDFFDVLAGGSCSLCNDIDFNNNGVFPEDQDVVDFFNVLAGGTCP
ncbi:MAG TPA: hypothetical protein VK157_00365 [Phycisphaerales bacterium]|nr:hypothetical protein [Phycisphaerales bacterium]